MTGSAFKATNPDSDRGSEKIIQGNERALRLGGCGAQTFLGLRLPP